MTEEKGKLMDKFSSGPDSKFMWEALNRQHEQSKKMYEGIHGHIAAGGIKPDELIVLAFPHPSQEIKTLYYTNTRTKDRIPPIIDVPPREPRRALNIGAAFDLPVAPIKIFEDVDSICLSPLKDGTTLFPGSIAQYLEHISPVNSGKSNLMQHFHIKIWYCKKGKKNPFRDLDAYAALYQLVKEEGQLNIDDGRWTIDENTEPYIPPKALQDKSVKHLQRTIRQLDKRLLHPGSNRYMKIHLRLMRSLTVRALEMKKEVK